MNTGHFSNKEHAMEFLYYSMGNSLTSTLRSMPGPSQDEKEEGGWVRLDDDTKSRILAFTSVCNAVFQNHKWIFKNQRSYG